MVVNKVAATAIDCREATSEVLEFFKLFLETFFHLKGGRGERREEKEKRKREKGKGKKRAELPTLCSYLEH